MEIQRQNFHQGIIKEWSKVVKVILLRRIRKIQTDEKCLYETLDEEGWNG